jgi:hypothetical protein
MRGGRLSPEQEAVGEPNEGRADNEQTHPPQPGTYQSPGQIRYRGTDNIGEDLEIREEVRAWGRAAATAN